MADPDYVGSVPAEGEIAINYQAVVAAIREASRVMGEEARIITASSGLA